MVYLFSALLYWLSLFFVVPFSNLEVLWILIPTWLNFIFTEFFQERKGTSLGNAVSNGAVILWVGIDWIRFLTRNYESFSWIFMLKVLLCVLLIGWGFLIIIWGIKGKDIIRRVGRIREVTYIMLALTPFIYGMIEPSLKYFLTILIFGPLFYLIFELLDRYMPGAETFEEKYDK